MLVLDVPSPSYIPSLMASFAESSYFAKFRSKSEEDMKEYNVNAIFHMCGDGVLENEEYKRFMNGFSDATHVSRSRRIRSSGLAYSGCSISSLRASTLPIQSLSQVLHTRKPV